LSTRYLLDRRAAHEKRKRVEDGCGPSVGIGGVGHSSFGVLPTLFVMTIRPHCEERNEALFAYAVAYGTAGSLVVILIWVYYAS
jgi:hypothetical protein